MKRKSGTGIIGVILKVVIFILITALIGSGVVFALRSFSGNVTKPPVDSTGGSVTPDDGDDSTGVNRPETPSGVFIPFGTEEMSKNNAGTWYFNTPAQTQFTVMPTKTDSNALIVSAESWGGEFSFYYTPKDSEYDVGDYYSLDFTLTLSCAGTVFIGSSKGGGSYIKLENYIPKQCSVNIRDIQEGGEVIKITLPADMPAGATLTVSNIHHSSGVSVDLPMIPLGDFSTKGVYDGDFIFDDVLMNAVGT